MKAILKFISIILCQTVFAQEIRDNCLNYRLSGLGFVTRDFYQSVKLEFFNFNNFNQFNPACFKNLKICIFILKFLPNRKLILNNELNYTHITSSLKIGNSLKIQFVDLEGFDLANSPKAEFVSYEFYYTNLRVLNNCSEDFISPFEKAFILDFAFTVKYFLNTCPILFKNSNINSIRLYGLSDSFLKRNLLGFKSLNQSLNSSIKSLELNFYKGGLFKSLLDIHVFNETKEIKIKGVLNEIENNLFTNFFQLKYLTFELINAQSLFIKSSLWLKSLHRQDEMSIIFDFDQYEFTEQDFCLFKHFPLDPKLQVCVRSDLNISCTCTIIWLMQYSFELSNDCNKKIVIDCKLFDSSNCNFTRNLEICEKNRVYNAKKVNSESKVLDKAYKSEIIDFVTIVLTPFIAVTGMLNNLASILILAKKEKLSR